MSALVLLTLPSELLALTLPFYTCLIPAGFPSPAEDYEEQPLDLNRYLFAHPASTFLARITGDSMTGAGIHPGDIITVDRAIPPADGHIVVAVVDGEHTVKRLRRRQGRVWLEAENDRYPALELLADSRLDIWGVVTHVIHSFVGRSAAGGARRN